jgi:hypothetical protein
MLAAPAAAQAATYTVKVGDGPCGGADLACGGLAEAADAAAVGDVFKVAQGNAPYGSATFDVGGVTIVGDPIFVVNGTLTFTGGSGGPAKLQKVGLSQGNGTAPGVVSTGAAGLEISDAFIHSQNDDAVRFTESAANKIVRSTVATSGTGTSAVKVTSSDTSSSTKGLLMESTLVTGGAAGLAVVTGESAPVTTAGDVNVTLRHVTAAGSTNGLRLDSSKAAPILGGPVGNITATVSDSIIQNGTSKTIYPGLLGALLVVLAPPNTITDTYTRTLQEPFDQNAVFANPAAKKFQLRPGSPAIGVGGFTAGESTTDYEGDPRDAAPTDLGFDEYVNKAPKAVIEVKTVPQRSTRPVTFDGSKSTDPETGAGGGIKTYRWEFGDGKTEDTATPTVNHTYTGEGDATVKLTVVDAQGAVSAPASVPIKLVDGLAPAIVITKPTANQKIRLTKKTTRTRTVTVNGKKVKRKTTTTKRTRIGFAGTAKDKSGVKGVVLTVERISKTATSSTAAKSSAATTTKRCAWLDPKKGIVLRSCSKPVLILAKLAKDGAWTYNVKSTIRLSAGLYRVIVAGQDNAGAAGNSAPAKDAIHRFRLVK